MVGHSSSRTRDIVKLSSLIAILLFFSVSFGLYLSLEGLSKSDQQSVAKLVSSQPGWIRAVGKYSSVKNHAPNIAPFLWIDEHSQQVEKKDKNGKILHHQITSITAKDLQGLQQSPSRSSDSVVLSVSEARKGREYTLKLLADAGIVDIESTVMEQLPLWRDVASLYYTDSQGIDVTEKGPVIIGLDTCQRFRSSTPPDDASVAVAGLFNTGTNPAAMYLSANCEMPNNTKDKAGHGMRWQAPWGKHMLASRKWNNTAHHDTAVNKSNVLPVVFVRDPFTWMASMCKHPYAARWKYNTTNCPNLVRNGQSNKVTIKYPKEVLHWDSLLDLWIDWYSQYLDSDFPRLLVRFEDLVFRPKELVNEVCTCAGAVAKSDRFSYVVDAGKWGSSVHKGSSNRITAMIKYGKSRPPMSDADKSYAHEKLRTHEELMQLFQYRTTHSPS